MIVQLILMTALILCAFWHHPAQAANIDGVWATDAAACSKIYVKSAKGIAFAKRADLYGSGFIIDGNKIRGKIASCNIKMRKQDGNTVHLIAVCSTDIAIDTMQFTLNVIDDNKVSRVFPGMPELETPYERCFL
jgi:hypothetical protein